MIAWLSDLNAKERKTVGACFGGWALDAFDVQMYSFVIPAARVSVSNSFTRLKV
jgi:hypothetical protein